MLVDDPSYEDLIRLRRESARNHNRFQNGLAGSVASSDNFYSNFRSNPKNDRNDQNDRLNNENLKNAILKNGNSSRHWFNRACHMHEGIQ
jgi:hypothetical protein